MFSQGYLIDTQICVVALWLLYIVLLHRRINLTVARIYLLCLLPLGMLLPLIEIPLLPAVELVELPLIMMTDTLSVESIDKVPSITYLQILMWLYWSGVMFFGGWTMITILRTWRRTRQAVAQVIGTDRVVFSSQVASAYSVFGTIFVNDKYEGSPMLGQILTHERSHITHCHSADLVWMTLTRSLLWFNPLSWHTLKLLREVHEFQADRAVILQGGSVGSYLELLIGTESGIYPDIANALCYSLTKKRLKMIAQNKRGNTLGSYVRLAAFIPMLGLLLGLFSLTAKASEVELTSIAQEKTTPSDTTSSDKKPIYIIDGVVSTDPNFNVKENLNPDDIEQITVLKGKSATDIYGEQGKNGAIVITTKKGVGTSPINVIDGVIIPEDEISSKMRNLNPNNHERVILNSEAAIAKYGEKGKYGAFVITTKNTMISQDVSPAVVIRSAKTLNPENSPIYVIDGVVSTDPNFNVKENLNPDDIEQITVLKGKSATDIYGEQGKNGAIVITTKKGSKKSRK